MTKHTVNGSEREKELEEANTRLLIENTRLSQIELAHGLMVMMRNKLHAENAEMRAELRSLRQSVAALRRYRNARKDELGISGYGLTGTSGKKAKAE